MPKPERTLSAEGLIVAAPGRQTQILHGVSLRLEAGQGLGIIGPSASGKSTFVRALVGVWRPLKGEVRRDGAALGQWEPGDLGRHIGYLPQDIELFDGSVADNIARFQPEVPGEAIVAAAKAAGAHDVIVKLENGCDTLIGEGGTALSGGQRQRIGLARALYGDPFLVVLDEPNSNLDHDGDEALTGAVRGVRSRGGIVVVVTHRQTAIAGVDHIAMMAEGRIQAFGPKDEVLQKIMKQGGLPSAQRPASDGDLMSGAVASDDEPTFGRTLTRLTLVGFAGVFIFAGTVGVWAVATTLSGAVVASGQFVVDGNVKKVQHATGGIVGELKVREGDRVEQDQVVIRLDDTVTRSNLQVVTKQLDEFAARVGRLRAERDRRNSVTISPVLMSRLSEPEIAEIVSAEQSLFEARRAARDGQKAQLARRIGQLQDEIAGLKAQQVARNRQASLIEEELLGVRDLYAKNLVALTRKSTLEREAANLDGQKGQLIASVAQAEGKIAETQLQTIHIDRRS